MIVHKMSATFSRDRVYRYTLTREWSAGPTLVGIGLNCSTADETADDPTIRRMLGFAKRDGFGRFVMLNLFAFRSTDPCGLLTVADPIGHGNDEHILATCTAHDTQVVAAWGSHTKLGALVPNRARDVRAMLRRANVHLYCFGVNANGQPKHPLYLAKSTPIGTWVTA